MSFSINFTARSVSSAKAKLAAEHAPGVVKALIEKALDALPPAAIPPVHQEEARSGSAGAAVGAITSGRRKPEFIGLRVEASGHIGDPGDHGDSWINKFLVQPLWD